MPMKSNEYKKLYMSRRWKAIREVVLARDKYRCQVKNCGQFLQSGRNHARSAVVHHIEPHKGNLGLFYDLENLQAVCWTCHSGEIQSEEALGYSKTIGEDGWPVDPKFPNS
jgi:5-methylcytosine-specific restriction enzyme A